MAEIVLGLGTSHSPQLSIPADLWGNIAKQDRHNPYVPYEALMQTDRPQRLAHELTLDRWQAKYEACQNAIRQLGEMLATSSVDVVLVIGDDQEELWLDDMMPAITMFRGESAWDLPTPIEDEPEAYRPAHWAEHGDEPEAYPASPDLANYLIEVLTHNHFDISQFSRQPEGRSLGHAFTFVRRRLMKEHLKPMLPVMINTYYPPNQPTLARCYALGQAVQEAIEKWPESIRVAVVASGGLSHFVIDEELDRRVIAGIMQCNRELLTSIPEDQLQAGNSEIRNWVAVAGALEHLKPDLIDYIPTYRSPAGTGVGMTFMCWR